MSAKDVRNICLLGHGGSGKTTLAESMLFLTGGTDRFGRVPDGNTVCDYDAEETKRNISISLAMAPVKYKNVKINVPAKRSPPSARASAPSSYAARRTACPSAPKAPGRCWAASPA